MAKKNLTAKTVAALQPSSLPHAPERAQALLGAARLALHQGDLYEADTFAQEGEELEPGF